MSKVIVQDYDPCWPQVFEDLRSPIQNALSDICLSIEHVGSTAVPGLPAKPVVDIDVVVRATDLEKGISGLGSLGYIHRGNLGIAERHAFNQPAGLPKHHAYLCPEGSTALANHLAVRDYLRANDSAVREYGALKKRLAAQYPNDIDSYVEGKTNFLVSILNQVGFDPMSLAEIVRVNKRPQT